MRREEARLARRCMLTGVCVLFVAVVSSAPARGRSAGLDWSFGHRGRVLTATADQPEAGELEAGSAWAGGGKIVVAGGRTVVEYLPDGRLNRRFGHRGRIEVHSPQGIRFRLKAMTVDTKGRVLIAGTSEPVDAANTPGPSHFPGPPPRWATVTRYLWNGKRDVGFGSNGTVNSTLGLPPPEPRSGIESGGPLFHYQTPSVEVTGLSADSHDRLILTGTFVSRVALCYPSVPVNWTGAYVARLLPAGDVDLTFNGTGRVEDTETSWIAEPVSTAGDQILYRGLRNTQCQRGAPDGPGEIFDLDGSGQPIADFGLAGSTVLTDFQPEGMDVDATGEVAVVGDGVSFGPRGEERQSVAAMLSPRGQLDHGFGNDGFADLPHGMRASAVGRDKRDRLLVVGSRRLDRPQRVDFLLARILPLSGRLDTRFGHHGLLGTAFGGHSRAIAQSILVGGRGDITVTGTVVSARLATSEGFALARYRP